MTIHEAIQQYRPEISQTQVVSLIRKRLSLVELLEQLGIVKHAASICHNLDNTLELHQPIILQPEIYKVYRLCP